MYFSIKPMGNSTYYNYESLELIKNLQSLGQTPTSSISANRQKLQVAEYEKLKSTLGNNEQNIKASEVSFDSMLQTSAAESSSSNSSSPDVTNQIQPPAQEEQSGANQLAALNKYWHNIAA